MRILFLCPEDNPTKGPWARESWDRVVDMGVGSEYARSRWSVLFSCGVEAIPDFENQASNSVREALASGLGQVVDQYGLDWWELIAIRFCEHFEILSRLRNLKGSISPKDQVFVTRNGVQATVLAALLSAQVRCFGTEPPYTWSYQSALRSVARKIGALRNFSPSQVSQTLADKYDATYRVRRLITSPAPSRDAVVLLPVAHVTATRTAISYAAMLPEERFLLVATRQNGWTTDCPANASATKLAAYAPGKCNVQEQQQLLMGWRRLESIIKDDPNTSALWRAGVFEGASRLLRHGLAVRDSWLRVFKSQTVSAVLCTDTTNPNTHMPLLLARNKAIPTIACHHGALDGYYLVKRNHADVVLAKGEMERDYLRKTCGVAEEKIEVGGYELPLEQGSKAVKDAIVFFSEPYALAGGRCPELYRELLPMLAELARSMNLRLVLKLHPMESKRERSRLVEAALPMPERKILQIKEGPLTDNLLDCARFAVTLQSTAAVDCAIRGIPVFLCCWLGYSHYSYAEQFVKFGAALPLYSANEIAGISRMLENFTPPRRSELWETISPAKLRLLFNHPVRMATAV